MAWQCVLWNGVASHSIAVPLVGRGVVVSLVACRCLLWRGGASCGVAVSLVAWCCVSWRCLPCELSRKKERGKESAKAHSCVFVSEILTLNYVKLSLPVGIERATFV